MPDINHARVGVALDETCDITIHDADIPDGQSIEDVAIDRAIELVIDNLRDYPGAFATIDEIEDPHE